MAELPGVAPPPLGDAPLRRALDALREGFQIVGFDWKYIYLNPAAARHGRCSPRELVGRTMAEAYPGIDQTPLYRMLRRAMYERTSHVFENHFTFPDGSSRWFEIRIQPVPEGICIYSADIESRKQAEQAASDKVPHRGAWAWLRRKAKSAGYRIEMAISSIAVSAGPMFARALTRIR